MIISASIDVDKIDKAKLVVGKTGVRYYPITVIVNDELNEYGQDVSITEGQSKEEREAKAKKKYIGNGKKVWSGGSSRSVQEPLPEYNSVNDAGDRGGMPF